MASPAVLAIRIVADAKDASQEFDNVAGKSRKLAAAGVVAGAGLAALAAGAVDAVRSASDLQQAYGAVESVFKDNSDAVKQLASDAAESTGLAASAYAQMASVIGSQLKNAGTPADELVGSTDALITKGADLAAMFGGTTAEAVEALSSLLKGERDPIEKYGVSIKQADIEAQKAKMGLKGLTGEAAKQAEMTATLALLQEQTADATGAAAREQDTLAGSQQRATAQMENAKAALGQALLPLFATFASLLSDVAGYVSQNATLFGVLAAVLAVIALGVLAVNASLAVYNAVMVVSAAATAVMNTALWGMVAALLANPIVLIVAGIVALIAALVLAYKKSETFRNIVNGAFNTVRTTINSVLTLVTGAFARGWGIMKTIAAPYITAITVYITVWRTIIEAVINAVQVLLPAALRALKAAAAPILAGIELLFSGLQAVVDPIISAVEKLIGLLGKVKIPKIPSWANPFSSSAPSVAAPMSLGAPRLTGGVSAGGTSLRASSGGGGPTIIVNGALDPVAVAEQIQRILRSQARRNGYAT